MTNIITQILNWWADNEDREEYARTGEVVKTYGDKVPAFVVEAQHLGADTVVLSKAQLTAAIKLAFEAGWDKGNENQRNDNLHDGFISYSEEEQKAITAAETLLQEK